MTRLFYKLYHVGTRHYSYGHQLSLLHQVNRFGIISCVILLTFTLLNIFYNQPLLILSNGTFFVLMALTFVFNYFGQLSVAKYYQMGVVWLYLLLSAIIVGEGIGIRYFFIVIGVGPLFITNKRKVIFSFLILSILSFLGVSTYYNYYPALISIPEWLERPYYFLDMIIFFIIMFVIIYYFKMSEQRYSEALLKNKQTLEHQKKQITDSLRYARQIQRAILPRQQALKQWLNKYFIFYRPKDVVSGDFYWAMRQNDKVLFAAVDCTGHGVPGAFMSMIGASLLNDIVHKQNITHPAPVLHQLREEVMYELRQRGEQDEIHDGMDMSLCTWDESTQTLHYAGANNALYVITEHPEQYNYDVKTKGNKNNKSLIEVPPTQQPVGYYPGPTQDFQEHTLHPQTGDQIFLFSDGYPDQFGGPRGKKLTYKRFRHILLEISQYPIAEQQQLLEKRFDDWKQREEQLDDVLVMSVKW